MKYTFVSLIEGDNHDTVCDTFEQAFTEMYYCINKHLDNKGLSWQALETCFWIKFDGLPLSPFFWPEARDRAIDQGILKDGKLV